jgi:hypothetical protein
MIGKGRGGTAKDSAGAGVAALLAAAAALADTAGRDEAATEAVGEGLVVLSVLSQAAISSPQARGRRRVHRERESRIGEISRGKKPGDEASQAREEAGRASRPGPRVR